MIVNPDSPSARLNYLLDNSDWSLLITGDGEKWRDGGDWGDERVLWYTSGTTGDSKFCSFTQAQLDNMAATICRAYRLDANDRYTSVMSLWHAHGQGFYWATRLAGCQTTFLSVKNIRELPGTDPTFITAIPDVLNTVTNFNFRSLRFIRSASAPLSDELYDRLQDKFKVPVIEAFGMTEAMSHCFTNPLGGPQRRGTVGLPDGIDAKIDGGELYIKGKSVCRDGWYNTGDLAEQDDCGYYKILGRSRDQINVRGYKINPVSIERQLLQSIPGLISCAVFGNSELKCVYVGDCSEDVIRTFLMSLSPYCRPAVLTRVDAIPLSGVGKISRALLNSLY